VDPFLAQTAQSATNGGIELLSATAFDISGSSWNSASNIYYTYLNPMATNAAMAMLPLFMTVEIIFCGFRIMMGKTITEQAVKILFASMVCYVLVFSQFPQRLMVGAILDMQEVGRAVGGSMMRQSAALANSAKFIDNLKLTNDHDLTPMKAWAAWVDPMNDHQSYEYKYGFRYIRHNLFADPTTGFGAHEASTYVSMQSNQNLFLSKETWDGLWDYSGGFLANLMKSLGGKAITAAGMLYVMSPMTAFSYAIPIAFSIMAGTVAPMWVQASVLSASYYSFFMVLSLGVAVVPLCFFTSFVDIWKTWLKFLIGTSLIPMLFYLFGGVGFVFATGTYSVMFPAQPETGAQLASMSWIYGGVLQESIGIAYAASVPDSIGTLNNLADFMQSSMKLFFRIFMLLGRQGGGCAIVTTFILAGTAFPIAAIKMAESWANGFASDAVFTSVMQAFETMRSGIGTAIGQQYSTGMEMASQAASKIGSMLLYSAIGGAIGGLGGAAIGAGIGALR
jgi:hypothetical protein